MDSVISWALLVALAIYLGLKLIDRIDAEKQMQKTRSERAWEELERETNADNWQDWCEVHNIK